LARQAAGVSASEAARRAARALADSGRILLRQPRRRIPVLRALATAYLDLLFDFSSPLTFLDVPAAGDDLISLPAPQIMDPGNQSVDGLARLVALARAIDARRVFEIGTYNGLTALTLAANLPNATIDTLDLPPGKEPLLRISESDLDNVSCFPARRYEGRDEAAQITQHLGDSATFDFGPFARAFDLVYVDGAHSWEYVENDSRAAFEMVKPDGVIVWDDYWRYVPDVPGFLHTIRDRTLCRIAKTRLVVWLGPGARERLAAN